MSNKNVSVVGAGISGIIAAYFEVKKGHNVTLIESDARAGGLLKSDFQNGKYFDYGTHILSETGEKELDDLIFSDFSPQDCFINNKINVANYHNKRMNDKPSKKTWRVPPDFRLVNFHEPLLKQAPVIFFICGLFIFMVLLLSVIGYS